MPQNFSLYTDFIKNKEKLDLERACKKLEIAVSIFHGEQDNSVAPSEGALLASWTKSELSIIKDTDHVFGSKHPWVENDLPQNLDELCKKTHAFLLKK